MNPSPLWPLYHGRLDPPEKNPLEKSIFPPINPGRRTSNRMEGPESSDSTSQTRPGDAWGEDRAQGIFRGPEESLDNRALAMENPV